MKIYLSILLAGVFVITLPQSRVMASDSKGIFERWDRGTAKGIMAVDEPRFVALCGGCHYSYQPGFLPALSWERLLQSTDNHYGVALDLSRDEIRYLYDYLLNNAGGRVNYTLSNSFMRSLRGDPAPLRITDNPYFIERHSGVAGDDMNDAERTNLMGKCAACHTDALQGGFEKAAIQEPEPER